MFTPDCHAMCHSYIGWDLRRNYIWALPKMHIEHRQRYLTCRSQRVGEHGEMTFVALMQKWVWRGPWKPKAMYNSTNPHQVVERVGWANFVDHG